MSKSPDENINIVCLHGQEAIPYIPALAELRIQIFKEYPYLYVGDLAYEKDYLNTYVNSPQTTIVLVFDGTKIVGASTSIPLNQETDNCKKPFISLNMAIDEIYYLGESVLLPAYRGQGIYQYFFAEREQAGRAAGCRTTTFCAVDRAPDDPRKPANYTSLDNVWRHFGYEKHPELQTDYEWKEIGETQSSAKSMTFWLKNL